ncbi:retinoic acid receptor responder protein 2 isoform X1 [Microcaecilia unicolor]|uniref:Retinoic acid receptor responder protein 2 n=1 Tax=Microcaecilia unicolor TaxID=1415580 RepID=A0A6P7XMN5_9AMPH|nr:retinoic acid receptor responder protein 2-like isoform X1 [Microcaecilia unicolor]
MKGALNIFYFGLAAAIAFVAAVEEEELTEMQKKVLGLSLQEYHKKEHVINAFKVSSIQSITETVFSQGTFVHLQLLLEQTSCRKHQWQKKDCKILRRARRLNCVTCYKIEEESLEVVSSYMDCIPEQLLQTDREEGRREKCNEVKQTRETGLGLPGIFSFSRSRH